MKKQIKYRQFSEAAEELGTKPIIPADKCIIIRKDCRGQAQNTWNGEDWV